MLRESCLSILSIDLSLELGAKFAYLPAIYYSSYVEGQWVAGKPRIKEFLGNGWMHVVVSSSRAVVQHYIIIFCNCVFWFHCCPWGELPLLFLTGPLFVLYSMHFIPLLIVWLSVSP